MFIYRFLSYFCFASFLRLLVGVLYSGSDAQLQLGVFSINAALWCKDLFSPVFMIQVWGFFDCFHFGFWTLEIAVFFSVELMRTSVCIFWRFLYSPKPSSRYSISRGYLYIIYNIYRIKYMYTPRFSVLYVLFPETSSQWRS